MHAEKSFSRTRSLFYREEHLECSVSKAGEGSTAGGVFMIDQCFPFTLDPAQHIFYTPWSFKLIMNRSMRFKRGKLRLNRMFPIHKPVFSGARPR